MGVRRWWRRRFGRAGLLLPAKGDAGDVGVGVKGEGVEVAVDGGDAGGAGRSADRVGAVVGALWGGRGGDVGGGAAAVEVELRRLQHRNHHFHVAPLLLLYRALPLHPYVLAPHGLDHPATRNKGGHE